MHIHLTLLIFCILYVFSLAFYFSNFLFYFLYCQCFILLIASFINLIKIFKIMQSIYFVIRATLIKSQMLPILSEWKIIIPWILQVSIEVFSLEWLTFVLKTFCNRLLIDVWNYMWREKWKFSPYTPPPQKKPPKTTSYFFKLFYQSVYHGILKNIQNILLI